MFLFPNILRKVHDRPPFRLVSYPWIYTQLLAGLIHWNLNGRELKSEISDWRIDSDF